MSTFGDNFRKAAQEFLGTTPEDKKLREEAASKVRKTMETAGSGDAGGLSEEDRAEISKLIDTFVDASTNKVDETEDHADEQPSEGGADELDGADLIGSEFGPYPEPELAFDAEPEPESEYEPMALQAPPEPTIIAAETVITGNVEARGPVQLQGFIRGDLISKSSLKLSGKLAGNAQGFNIHVLAGAVQGAIQADGDVEVDADSLVVGPIYGNNITINGMVKGDLHATGSVALQANAKVKGDVTAAVVSIRERAVLDGKLQVTSTDLDGLFNIEP